MKLTMDDGKAQEAPVNARESENALDDQALSRKDRLKVQQERERARWKSMRLGEKISYFAMYYLKTCLITVAVIAILIVAGINIYNNFKPHSLQLALINTEAGDAWQSTAFETDYRQTLDISDSLAMKFYPSYSLDESSTDKITSVGGSVGASDDQILESLMKHGSLDAIITDRKGLEYLGKCEYAPEVYTVLEACGITGYESYYTTVPDQDGYDYVLAIDISSSDKLSLLELPYTEAYLIFANEKTACDERAVELLEYLLPLE